jgi:hypothetical protein
MGGLFDAELNNWRGPHDGHRLGREADIGFRGVQSGICRDLPRAILHQTIRNVTGRWPIPHSDHYHAIVGP